MGDEFANVTDGGRWVEVPSVVSRSTHDQATVPRWVRVFVISAGGIFLITGLAKIISAFGQSDILSLSDPIFGISFRKLMIGAGIVELLVSMACLFSTRNTLSLGLVAWLTMNLAVYRTSLWCIGWHRPCSCLGNLTDTLHLPTQQADLAMKFTLGYLLAGSCIAASWRLWRQSKILAILREKRAVKIVLLSVVLVLIAPAWTKASEYEVSGTLISEQLDAVTQKPLNRNEVQFSAFVNGCKWLFNVEVKPDSEFSPAVWSFDGEYLYNYSSGPRNVPTNDPSLILGAGTIWKAAVPEGSASIGVLWMALASECYLNHLEPRAVFPVVFREGPAAAIRSTEIFTPTNQEPCLPNKIVFLSSTTNAIYSVISHTNINGLQLPRLCELTIYQPPSSEVSLNLKLTPYKKWTIMVTQWSAHSSVTTFSPDIRKNTLITDYRIAANELNLPLPPQYSSDYWLTLGQVKNTPEFVRLHRMALQAAATTRLNRNRVSKWIVFAVISISTATVISVLFWNQVKKKRLIQ